MTLALIVMGIMAIVMYNKGYAFEKMLPKVLLTGAIIWLVPKMLFGIAVLPFHLIGGIAGAFGGIIGTIMGLVGGLIGLVFGAVGLIIGLAVLAVPLLLIVLLVKALT